MLKNTLLATMLLCAAAGSASAASSAVVSDPNWTHHSSFDNAPRRIVATPDHVYFFVHQRPFDQNRSDEDFYRYPTGALFILDKQNPGQLLDLHRVAPLSGNDVRAFEVDPQTGAMAFSYTDGGIDVVTPDHRVNFFDNVGKRVFPGASTVNHISFDATRRLFWFSTNSGYLAVSTKNFQVAYEAPWTEAITDMNSVGNRVVAIIGGAICQADGNSPLQRRSSFTPIAGLNLNGDPMRILPLDANNFAVPTLSGRIYFVTLNALDNWAATEVVNNANILLPQYNYSNNASSIVKYQYVIDRLEHNCVPTAEGWMVSAPDRAYLLNRPANAAAQATVKEVVYPSAQDRWSSTADGHTFWFYRDRGQFASATLDGTTWSDFSEPVRPNAPLTNVDLLFSYSPKYGLVAVNHSDGTRATYGYIREAAMLCAYKNGKWTNLAGCYNLPYYADVNSNFASGLNANIHRWPVADPRGLVIDPIFPDYVWMGSTSDGIVAMNLADPRAMPLCTVVKKNHWLSDASFPTLKYLPASTNGSYNMTHIMGADADGNIWAMFLNHWPAEETNKKNYIRLIYLTPDGRREALETGDPTLLDWKLLEFNLYENGNFNTMSKVFTHPANAGLSMHSYNTKYGWTRYAYIYDTNGTLEDPSDDSFVSFRNVRTPDGAISSINNLNDIVEDPATGAIYILSPNGTWVIDNVRKTDFSDPDIIDARRLTVKTPEGLDSEILAPLSASKGCFDEYGRLWVASTNSGVICLDPGTGLLVAQYNTSNSPLPDNACYGIGWNPDTKSVFISTEFGIAEVKPDAPAYVSNTLQQPFVKPESVAADYTGTVTVRNVPEALTLSVLDADGREVAVLPLPNCGVTHWDLRDAQGRRVAPGVYRFADKSHSSNLPSLSVIVAE